MSTHWDRIYGKKANKQKGGKSKPPTPPVGPTLQPGYATNPKPPPGLPSQGILSPSYPSVQVPTHNSQGAFSKTRDFERAHNPGDTDFDRNSLHHTLGPNPNQAAPGDHKHDLTGDIKITANTTVQDGYLKCDGTVYNIADYPDLGALVGATFGGDGITTFGVPTFTTAHIPSGTMAMIKV